MLFLASLNNLEMNLVPDLLYIWYFIDVSSTSQYIKQGIH